MANLSPIMVPARLVYIDNRHSMLLGDTPNPLILGRLMPPIPNHTLFGLVFIPVLKSGPFRVGSYIALRLAGTI